MRILIDARGADPDLRVFGMSLVERILNALRRAPNPPEEVRVLVGGAGTGDAGDDGVPVDPIVRRMGGRRSLAPLNVTWTSARGSLAQIVDSAIASTPGSDWLLISGDSIVDARLLSQLARLEGNVFFASGEGEERGALVRLGSEASLRSQQADSVLDLSDALAKAGAARPMRGDEFDAYIVNLRRELAPYLFTIRSDGARRRVERFMFWSNYKGSTDFMTKYVWPPLVWVLVRPLARWRVHPNWVTGISIVATLAAIPLWMAGWWGTGFCLAYTMSLLDSVDGKLARLTFTYSKLGNVLDHGLDLVHPPFWYLAWASGFAHAGAGSDVIQASWWMFGLYVADRLCAPIFKARTGRSIHGYLPIDVQIRTFISRRNVNLPFFTAAIAIDLARPGSGFPISIAVFHAMVIWQAVCFVYHAVRTVQFFDGGPSRVEQLAEHGTPD